MTLKILLPSRVFLDRRVEKVTAEAANGSFTLLPRHIDFVTALVPGLLYYIPEGESGEEFMATDEGVLVKRSDEVLVSVRNAVSGPDLGLLKETVKKRFATVGEREKKTRSAVAHLESSLVRKFIELSEER